MAKVNVVPKCIVRLRKTARVTKTDASGHLTPTANRLRDACGCRDMDDV
jgi:hypothetical protein